MEEYFLVVEVDRQQLWRYVPDDKVLMGRVNTITSEIKEHLRGMKPLLATTGDASGATSLTLNVTCRSST